MTPRERTLAIILLGFILLAGGGFAGYTLFYQPIMQRTQVAANLEKEVDELQEKVAKLRKDQPRLAVARKRSLPADEALAKREYYAAMERLLRQANVAPGFTITPKTVANTRTIPTVGGKKPVYNPVAFEINFKKADMWQVHDFLQSYYRLNLLHQITSLQIKREEESGTRRAAAGRNDLSVTLTTEAVILDGAENRRTLLPVPSAFAATGGWAGFDAVLLTPEAGRGLNPLQLAPVLATRPRDYTLLVQRDIFHGPLPAPPPFKIARIPDVTVTPDAAPPPVKVAVAGDGAVAGRMGLSAKAKGSMFGDADLKVDPKTMTITFPEVKDAYGVATVEVTATSVEGKKDTATFKMTPAPTTKAAKDDVSAAILLIGVTTRSDGTAFANIRDNANRLTYEVDATARGVKITKYYYLKDTKKKDIDYEDNTLLIISDETSSTNRRFKVVAVDEDGLVVEDLKPPVKAGPGGAKPGVVPVRPGVPAAPKAPTGKGTKETPLAAVIGFAGAVAEPAAPSAAAPLYRWTPGKSLNGLVQLTPTEAEKLRKRAAAGGPVVTAVSADNE